MLILAICGKFDDKLLKFEKRKNIATKIIEINISENLQGFWTIHLETFTSLLEFVKNYLVKIRNLCH